VRDDSNLSPGLAAMPGQQMQGFGNALVGASDAALRIATQMQMNINQTQVDDALNKTRQASLDLTYDPDQGYAGIKGNAALKRDSGLSLPDEYGQKLQTTINDLSEGLGNDEQRRQFALRSNDIATSFKGNVEAHTLQEFKSYSLSVQDGAIKLGQDEAKRNWSDPVRVDTALSSVNTAVLRASQLQGKSANQMMSEMQAATSMVHLGVIDAALQNNNPTYASLYLDKNKGTMTADDILRVTGAVNRDYNARISQAAVTQTTQEFQNRFAPGETTKLATIVSQMESGGKDMNADGTPVVC
jgi:soluble lytic murein transglycosylase